MKESLHVLSQNETVTRRRPPGRVHVRHVECLEAHTQGELALACILPFCGEK